MQESKGHLFWAMGDELIEYLVTPDGQYILRAPARNAIAVDTGNRHGRYEGPNRADIIENLRRIWAGRIIEPAAR